MMPTEDTEPERGEDGRALVLVEIPGQRERFSAARRSVPPRPARVARAVVVGASETRLPPILSSLQASFIKKPN